MKLKRVFSIIAISSTLIGACFNSLPVCSTPGPATTSYEDVSERTDGLRGPSTSLYGTPLVDIPEYFPSWQASIQQSSLFENACEGGEMEIQTFLLAASTGLYGSNRGWSAKPEEVELIQDLNDVLTGTNKTELLCYATTFASPRGNRLIRALEYILANPYNPQWSRALWGIYILGNRSHNFIELDKSTIQVVFEVASTQISSSYPQPPSYFQLIANHNRETAIDFILNITLQYTWGESNAQPYGSKDILPRGKAFIENILETQYDTSTWIHILSNVATTANPRKPYNAAMQLLRAISPILEPFRMHSNPSSYIRTALDKLDQVSTLQRSSLSRE